MSQAGAQGTPPVWRWAQGFRTNQYNGPTAVAVDSAGNTYLAGYFDVPLPLGPGVTLTPQASDGFLAKFTPTGALVWARQLGGLGDQSLSQLKIATGAGGERLYVAGSLPTGTTTVDGQTITVSTHDVCIFTGCFNLQGQLQWLRPLTSSAGSTNLYDLALDAAGNSYLLGVVRGTVLLGTYSLATAGVAPREAPELFWAKFSAAGTCQWARQTPIPQAVNHEVPATALGVSPAGDALYLFGTIGDIAVSFAGLALPPALGYRDALLTKCDGLGQPRRVHRSGGTGGSNSAGRLDVLPTGDVATSLSFTGAASFGSYSFYAQPGTYRGAIQVQDTAGHVRWADAPSSQSMTTIMHDTTGTVYVAASGGLGAAFLGLSVLSYSAQGQLRWRVPAGNNEYGATAARGAGGSISVAGHYQTGAQFGAIFLAPYYVRGVGPESFYLAQLGPAIPTGSKASVTILPFTVYPNPVRNLIHLPGFPSGTQVKIVDLLGRIAMQQAASTTLTISGLPSGLYHVSVSDPTGQHWASRIRVE